MIEFDIPEAQIATTFRVSRQTLHSALRRDAADFF